MINKDNVLFYVGGLFLIFVIFLGVVTAYFARPEPKYNKQVEEKIYNQCVSGAPLDIPQHRLVEWSDRCADLAKSLSLVPCDK